MTLPTTLPAPVVEKIHACWRSGKSLAETRTAVLRTCGQDVATETIRRHFAHFCETEA